MPAPAERPGGRLLWSFRYAARGVAALVLTQANARIHAVAALLTLAAGIWLHLERWEWCAVIGAIGLVFAAEGLNTALEALTDLASPGLHPLAGRAKDLGAGAVLLAALAAAAIGVVVFLPKLAEKFG